MGLSLQSHTTCLWKLSDTGNLGDIWRNESQWHCRSLRYLSEGLSSSCSPHWRGTVPWEVIVRQSFGDAGWDVHDREITLRTSQGREKLRLWSHSVHTWPKNLHFVVFWKAGLKHNICRRMQGPFRPPPPFLVPISRNKLLEKDPEKWRKGIQGLHCLLLLLWCQNPWQKQPKGGTFVVAHSLEHPVQS